MTYIESIFQNLIRGNRVAKDLGITLPSGESATYGPGHTYLQCPEVVAVTAEGSRVSEVKKGQFVQLVAPTPYNTVAAYRFPILVKLNPELHEYAQFQSIYVIDPKESMPAIYASFRRDCDLTTLSYFYRIYLMQ